MGRGKREAGNLKLVGGRLCLDFANTVNSRAESHHRDYITCYADLLAWSQHAGLLAWREAEQLRKAAEEHPAKASKVHRQAVKLRETIYRIFSAVPQQRKPAASDVDVLNSSLTETLGHIRVVPVREGYGWDWDRSQCSLDQMLWPIVRSAADLLTSRELGRVGQCARRDACDWLFLDTSKNHRRRWCSMSLCGSLDKTRKYYYRKRSQRRTKG